MAGKQHGLRRPARIGLLNDKGILAILAKSSAQDTPIRRAEVVAALGPGWTRVKDPCNGETYVVPNTAGAQFAPGSMVFLASSQGNPGETIIAGQPPTNRGALGFVLNPRSEVMPIDISGANSHIAFFLGSIKATYYREQDAGDLIGDSPEVSESLSYQYFIREDERALVGGLSLAYTIDSMKRVSCFDPFAPAVYSYTVPDAYHVSGVHYANGYLWWCEGEDVEHGGVGTYATYFRLRRANCDLTDVTTMGSFEFDNYAEGVPHFSMSWTLGFSSHAQMTTGLIVDAEWLDKVNHETSGRVRIDWSYNGTHTHDPAPGGDPPVSDVTTEQPVPVNPHPTFGGPLLGGAYPLTI